jgi:excisionase family DNA binding protein
MLKTRAGEVVGTDVAPLTYTIDEVARVLGVNRNTAYQAARVGELPVIKIGRRMLVPKAAFERMLEGAGEKSAPKSD